LVEGEWWTNGDEVAEVSIDREIAESMNLKIGDELTFSAGGKTFSVTVQALEKLNGKAFLQISFLFFLLLQVENCPIHTLRA